MENRIKIVEEVEGKGVYVSYLQVTCLKCGTRWGVNPYNGTVSPGDMVCRNCRTKPVRPVDIENK